MPSNDDIDRLRLVRTAGVGPVTYRRLMRRYRSPAAALAAVEHLAGIQGAPPSVADARREFETVARLGGRMIFVDDPDYPPLLADLDDAPPLISVLGDTALLQRPSVAIVGGRNASAAGLRMTEMLAEALAPHVTIVSGLARGVDSIAHTAALRTGRTVAAIAGGLDVVYPAENEHLQRLIGERGAVITEAPPGTNPQARHFPRRNRLIAGLSLGVLVIEAARRSGSLITAGIARDLGRELFAVPGSPLDPRASGANDLIRDGAVLTSSAQDVLDQLPGFGALFPARSGRRVETEAEDDELPLEHGLEATDARAIVTGLLGPTPMSVDDLTRRCQLSAAAVMAALLELELSGRVETLPGNRFALLTDAGL